MFVCVSFCSVWLMIGFVLGVSLRVFLLFLRLLRCVVEFVVGRILMRGCFMSGL